MYIYILFYYSIISHKFLNYLIRKTELYYLCYIYDILWKMENSPIILINKKIRAKYYFFIISRYKS